MGQSCWRAGYTLLGGGSQAKTIQKLQARIEKTHLKSKMVLRAKHEEVASLTATRNDIIRAGRAAGRPTPEQLSQLFELDCELAARRLTIDHHTSVVARAIDCRTALEFDTDVIGEDSKLNDIARDVEALHKSSKPLQQIRNLRAAGAATAMIKGDQRIVADEKAGLMQTTSLATKAILDRSEQSDRYAQQRAYFDDAWNEEADLLALALPTVPTRELVKPSSQAVVVLE